MTFCENVKVKKWLIRLDAHYRFMKLQFHALLTCTQCIAQLFTVQLGEHV